MGMAGTAAWSWKGRPRQLAILPQEALGQGTCIVMLRKGLPPGVSQELGWEQTSRGL